MKETEENNPTTRDIILQTAEKLFLDRGYRNTSMRKIATEAKVNLGSIVYYFKTKDKLIIEVISRLFHTYMDFAITNGYLTDNSIENLFMYLLLVQAKINQVPACKKLFEELVANDVAYMQPSKITQQLYTKIVKQYQINISKEEMDLLSLTSKGVDHILLRKKLEGTIDIDYLKMNKLTAQTSILALGIDKPTIDQAFDRCIMRLDKKTLSYLK